MGNTFGIGFAIGATLSPTVSNVFTTVEQKIKSSSQRMEALSAKSKALATADALRTKVQETQRAYAAGGGRDPLLRDSLNRQIAAYKDAQVAAHKYGVAVADYGHAHAKTEAQLARTQNRLQSLAKAQAAAERRKEIRGGLMEAAVPVMAVAAPVKLAMGFESAMADVRKVTDFDAEGLKAFGNELLDMSTRIPMTAQGLTQIAAAAGQAGIAQNELLRFTEDAAVMATAFDMTAADAGSAMTGMRTNFKLTQDGVRELGDSINYLSNRYDAKAPELVDFVSRVGGTAATFRMTGQEVAALGTVFRATKVDTENAATAANAMFVRLGNAEKLPKEAQEALAGLGISAKGMGRAMQEDAQGAMLKFLRQVKASKNPLAALSAIFGVDHAPKILKIVGSLELYEEALKDGTDQKAYANSQQKEFNNVTDTAAARMQLAANAASKAGIALGTALLPSISSTLETITPYISTLGSFIGKHETLSTVVIGSVAGFTTLRIVGMGAAYMFHSVSGSFHMARAALAFLIPSLRTAAVAEGAAAAAANTGGVSALRASLAWAWHKATLVATAAATRTAAAGQWLLNAAMSANPVALVIKGVVALIGGMIYLYNTCEPVRTAFDAVFGFIGKKIGWALGELRTVGEWLGIVDKAEGISVPDGVVTAPPSDEKQPLPGSTPALPSKAELSALEQGSLPPNSPATPAKPSPADTPAPKPSGMGTSATPTSTNQKPSATANEPVVPQAGQSARPSQTVSTPGAAVNMSFTLNGLSDQGFAKRVVDALEANRGAFERIISDIVHDQERLSYGG